jgi:hypothetical protein
MTALFNRGLTIFLKITAYGVNCGPRKAPIAKTIACATITQRLEVAKAVAKTAVVIAALKRGPRASITMVGLLWVFTCVISYLLGRRIVNCLNEKQLHSAQRTSQATVINDTALGEEAG